MKHMKYGVEMIMLILKPGLISLLLSRTPIDEYVEIIPATAVQQSLIKANISLRQKKVHHLCGYITDSQYDQLPVGLIAQLVEH